MDYYNNETILTQAREIESLRQQLAAAESNIDTLTKELEVQSYWGPRWEVANTERLAALAACEAKDAALVDIKMGLDVDAYEWRAAYNALAIQPDASALKAHDKALIERCAKVPESFSGKNRAQVFNNELAMCAAAIRELKKEAAWKS